MTEQHSETVLEPPQAPPATALNRPESREERLKRLC